MAEAKSCSNYGGSVAVAKISIKQEYMKIQRKKVEGSQQRIEDAMVYFTVSCLHAQIARVRTFVQRCADLVEEISVNKPERGKK